jgi:hypothetical protein
METVFTYKVNVTLIFDPEINRGHLLIMTNHLTKFEVPKPMPSLVIIRKPFCLQGQCGLDF